MFATGVTAKSSTAPLREELELACQLGCRQDSCCGSDWTGSGAMSSRWLPPRVKHEAALIPLEHHGASGGASRLCALVVPDRRWLQQP
jgi:hypothetical protein